MDHTNNNLFIRKFDQTLFHGFYRTLYICFDDDRQFFQITCLNLIKEIIKGKFAFCFFKEVFLILGNKCCRKVFRFFVTRECHQDLTCIRHITKTKNLNRCGRSCFFDTSSSVIHHCTYLTATCACCNKVTYMKSTLLYKDRCNRTFTFVKLSLDNKTSGCTVRVRFQFKYFC